MKERELWPSFEESKWMMSLSIKILFFILIFATNPFDAKLLAKSPDFLIIESSSDDSVEKYTGNRDYLNSDREVASLFKIVIAWSALRRGIAEPDTRILVHDRHITDSPVRIDMHEAMFRSSNDYFRALARRIGDRKLRRDSLEINFFSRIIDEDWYGDPRWIVKAGKMKQTPAGMHRFIRKIAGWKVGECNQTKEELYSVMRWPLEISNMNLKLYGKTGSWGKAVWFNGFGIKRDGGWKAVTVFINGDYRQRDRAIDYFYSRFGSNYPASRQRQIRL